MESLEGGRELQNLHYLGTEWATIAISTVQFTSGCGDGLHKGKNLYDMRQEEASEYQFMRYVIMFP